MQFSNGRVMTPNELRQVVYSAWTKSWTIIHGAVLPLDTVILRCRPSKYNALVNGVYHGIMGYGFNGIREGDIHCFHFRNNQFSKLKAPIPHNFHTRQSVSGHRRHQEVQILGIWIKDGARVLGGKVGELLTSYDQDGNPVHQFQIKVRPHDQYELCLHYYVQSIAPLST